MRILLINDHKRREGGAETFVYGLAGNLEIPDRYIGKPLNQHCHKVEVFGSDNGENFASLFSRWYSFKWYKKTKEKIAEFNPDLIHINNCQRIVSPSVIDASVNSGVPVVITFHDFGYLCHRMGGILGHKKHKCYFDGCLGYNNDKYRNYKRLKLRLHRKMIKGKQITFVAPSKVLAKAMEKFLEVSVQVIPNGINIPEEMTNYAKTILYVGGLNEEKGLQTIVSVLNKVKGHDVKVLGVGELKDELQKKYINIRFLGYNFPESFYKEASIMVVPSIWMENCSYSVLEAMSYGLCVIASDIGGIPEQIEHMKTGMLFKAGDKKDFEEKLNYLLKNPKEIKRMGRNARRYVQRNNNWKKITKQYEELYK